MPLRVQDQEQSRALPNRVATKVRAAVVARHRLMLGYSVAISALINSIEQGTCAFGCFLYTSIFHKDLTFRHPYLAWCLHLRQIVKERAILNHRTRSSWCLLRLGQH